MWIIVPDNPESQPVKGHDMIQGVLSHVTHLSTDDMLEEGECEMSVLSGHLWLEQVHNTHPQHLQGILEQSSHIDWEGRQGYR